MTVGCWIEERLQTHRRDRHHYNTTIVRKNGPENGSEGGAGRLRGRPEPKPKHSTRDARKNVARNNGIAAMLRAGSSWSQIQAATGCSRATVAKIAKRTDLGKGSTDRALSA